MKNIKGNLRPHAAMARSNSESLPSARIRCDAGRIKVGDRTYQSASDALSAYMQQFDGRLPSSADSRNSVSVRNTSLNALIQKSAQNKVSSSVHRKCDPANVTGLLAGSFSSGGVNGAKADSVMTARSCLHNGVGSAQQNTKHSVSFVLPDSANQSQQHSKHSVSFDVSGSSQRCSSPRQHSTSLFDNDSKQHNSLNLHNITQNTTPDLLGFSHLDSKSASLLHYTTTASGDVSSLPVSKCNGFVDHGLQALGSRLIQHGQHGRQEDLETHTRSSAVPTVESQRAKSEVEVLLTEAISQSELNSLTQLSAGEGKLRTLLRETSMPESSCGTSSNKSVLQQEVEEALSRSAQLLENIKTDVLVSPRCVSDVGSLSTDVLLSINPQNPADTIPAAGGRESRSHHRYSYYTPGHHPRSLSVGPLPGGREQRSLHESGRRRSVDSLGPDSSLLAQHRFQDLNSSVSALSDSEDMMKYLRTVDVHSLSGLSRESKETELRAAGKMGPPSWIQELIPPTPTKSLNGKDLTDSIFSPRDASGGRKTPSWVSGLERSDVVSSVSTQDLHDAAETLVLGGMKKLHGADTVKKAFEAAIKADDSIASELSYAGPGLNYSDLVSSPSLNKGRGPLNSQRPRRPLNKVTRNHSFSGIGNSVSSKRDVDRSRPPVTMNRIYQDLAGVDMTRPKYHTVAPSLNSSLGVDSHASVLRRKVCEDSVGAKRSLDKYLSQLDREGKAVDGARWVEQKVAEIPRCSSVDMLNGLGSHPDMPSDITGASSITKDSNFCSKLCLDDPTLTPARHSKAVSAQPRLTVGEGPGERSVDADPDLLDGDRPWESGLPSFKDPVYVEDSSLGKNQTGMTRSETPTLSGGQQPGSMEALKQMLFRLQNEESSSVSPSAAAAAAAASAALQDSGDSGLVPALKDYDFEMEPGGQSLERALVHLGRLKTLVQTGTNPTQEQPASPPPQEQTVIR